MFHSWLDRWDEKRAQRGDDVKKTTNVSLDAERAFPRATNVSNIEEFCRLGVQASATPSFFRAPLNNDNDFERVGDFLKFPSEISTDVEENNLVWSKITESGSRDKALVIFHHWNASSRNRQIAGYLSKRGITVVEIAMPYHFERSRLGSYYADYMLSANLGRTIQSLRQAVWDGQKLIRWLKSEGYREISVLGLSLGSWVAGALVHRCVFRFSDHIALRFKVWVSSQFGSCYAFQTSLCFSPSDFQAEVQGYELGGL